MSKPETKAGRAGKGPRKTMTFRIDQDLYDWLYANVPRPQSLSDYVNDAIRERVKRERTK